MMMKRLLFQPKGLLLLLGALSLALAFPVRAQEANRLALISVSGQAEVKVAPDEAVFNIEVKNINKDLLAAKNLNDEVVRKILALARTYKIEPQNVQTDYINVEPEYEEQEVNEKTRRVFVGYDVSKTVVVRLRDLSRFEDLFSDLLKAGVTRIRSVEFRTTELRKHKDQARAMAIRAAREKAVALAKEIGQGVGLAFSITEEDTESRRDNASNNSLVTFGGSSSMSGSESTFAPGLISIRAQVSVSFRLN
jgi:uncharacterized protein YggE